MKTTQEIQVVETMRKIGGYATLRRLNELVDFSTWKTKTPEATVRRIVQQSDRFFRIRPGLWALEDMRDSVLHKFDLKIGNTQSEELFSHAYYQGLLVEIGNYLSKMTYIPAQDKNKKYMGIPLSEVSDITHLPNFTYEHLKRKAKTIDVIWFNERQMPSAFYEVEHTTDIKNSLSKFYELQDFHAKFYIVADSSRRKEFDDKLNMSIFAPIKQRIDFLDYSRVDMWHEGMKKITEAMW